MIKEENDILFELKECYKNRLLSVLVGAGFSKNVSDTFLSWGELLHDMIAELYANEIEIHYDNYLHQHQNSNDTLESEETIREKFISRILATSNNLKIVSGYISRKGFRESVETYIEERLPYADFDSNGNIVLKKGNSVVETLTENAFSAHLELLKLNHLQNIYTTNYENLLEFTSTLLSRKNHLDLPQLVICARELSDKIQYRNIIKIHGNLRTNNQKVTFDGDNNLCYILAEEDYASYTEKHNAFASLMRIAMLQGKFLLIGFSGSDENYKGWVNWMKDIVNDEDEDKTKIYIVDFKKEPIPQDLELYYKNHRIKVVSLIDKDRLLVLGFNEKEINSFMSRKLANEDKRDILTRFLHFLSEDSIEGEDSNRLPSLEPENGSNEVTSYQHSKTTLSNGLSNVKIDSFNYRQLWKEAAYRVAHKMDLSDIAESIQVAKKTNRFPKFIQNQSYFINEIIYKSELNNDDAFLLALAIDECGINPFYYSKLIKDKKELENIPLLNLLKTKEDTFNGTSSLLPNKNDSIIYENIQRCLFHLDFQKANNLIIDWNPEGYFVIARAMRLASISSQQDTAFNTLANQIEKEADPILKLYAINTANFISRRYPSPYNLDEFYKHGIDGLGDILYFMIQQLRGTLQKPKSRGWTGTTTTFDKGYTEYEKSLRVLRFISDSGIYLKFGITSFLDIASWYFVFQNLYEEFPYPCFFYSIQYDDKEVQKRIGQDFAFSPNLSKFNKDILVQSLKAYGDNETPTLFLPGIINTICYMYFVVEESLWFEDFKSSIFNSFVGNLDKFSSHDSILHNVQSALVALKDSENLRYVLLALINNYRLNPSLVNGLIKYQINFKYIDKEGISNVIQDTLKKLIYDYPDVNIVELIYKLRIENIASQETVNLFIQHFLSISIDSVPSVRTSFFFLCILTKDNSKALKKAKALLLKYDIWNCGVLDSGKGYTTPSYINLSEFQNAISFTKKEFQIILNNLRTNIEKYKKAHIMFHQDTMMRNYQIQYLSNVLSFIDGFENERRAELSDIRKQVVALLDERVTYKSLIEGMLSEQTMDVDTTMDNVIKGIKAKGLIAYLDEFNFIIDKAFIGDSSINNALEKIRIVVDHHQKELIDLKLCTKLNTLLDLYMISWSNNKEFKPVWSFDHLFTIASFLDDNGFRDSDAVKYWLSDPFVQKFIRQ